MTPASRSVIALWLAVLLAAAAASSTSLDTTHHDHGGSTIRRRDGRSAAAGTDDGDGDDDGEGGGKEGCLIWQPTCAAHPGRGFDGPTPFADDFDGAAHNETRCLERAFEFSAFCLNPLAVPTVALSLGSGALEVFPPARCVVAVAPQCGALARLRAAESGAGGAAAAGAGGRHSVDALAIEVDVEVDEHGGAAASEERCLARAAEYAAFCHTSPSAEDSSSSSSAVAPAAGDDAPSTSFHALYGPTGAQSTVRVAAGRQQAAAAATWRERNAAPGAAARRAARGGARGAIHVDVEVGRFTVTS